MDNQAQAGRDNPDFDNNNNNNNNNNINLPHYSGEGDDIDNESLYLRIASTIMKCGDASALEISFQKRLKEAILSSENKQTNKSPPLLEGEHQLLTLATYKDCTDAILYVNPLVMEHKGENKLILRCFETGKCKDFLKQNWQKTFSDIIKTYDVKATYIVPIFNDWDIDAFRDHKEKSKKGIGEKKGKTFCRITEDYETSIAKTLPIAHRILAKSFNGFAPGYIVFCQRDPRFTRQNCKKKNYFKVEGFQDGKSIETDIFMFMTNHPITQRLTLSNIYSMYGEKDDLTVDQQFEIISALPNYHHWASRSSSGVKMFYYFHPVGNSPRNLILGAIEDRKQLNTFTLVKNVVTFVYNNQYYIEIVPKPCTKKSSCHFKPKSIEKNDLREKLGMTEEDYCQTSLRTPLERLYQTFKCRQYNEGTIAWRENEKAKQMVIMNDYDSKTGEFKFHDYVMVSRISKETRITMKCTCDIYKVLSVTIQSNEWDGINCCHIRALNDIYSEFNISQADSDVHSYCQPRNVVNTTNTVMSEKMITALDSVSPDVLPLPSKDVKIVEKFAVRTPSGHNFIHIFKGNKSELVYIKCCSGLCMTAYKKKVNLQTLSRTDGCPHMKVFKTYMDANWEKHFLLRQLRTQPVNENVDEEDEERDVGTHDYDGGASGDEMIEYGDNSEVCDGDGVGDNNGVSERTVKKVNGFSTESGEWSFYTPFPRTVDKDAFSQEILDASLLLMTHSLNARKDPNHILDLYPSDIPDQCRDCKLPFERDCDGNFMYENDGNTTLYTSQNTIKARVFKLVCPNRNRACEVKWNGSKERIWRVSQQVCIVEELMWDYIQMVSTMKSSFSAFCEHVNGVYKRNRSEKSFITYHTFVKGFFSWASHQKREFRKQCPWCGDSPKVLACDGTKIGIMHQNLAIVPIDDVPTEAEQVNNTVRRFDRCFLPYPPKDAGETNDQYKARKQYIRDARSYLKSITGSSPSTRDPVKDSNLLAVVKEVCLPLERLFQRYLLQKMTTQQLESTKAVLHQLAHDAPIRAFVPEVLNTTIENLINDTFNAGNVLEVIEELSKFNPRLGQFVNAFFDTSKGFDLEAKALISYLKEQKASCESNDPEPGPAVEIEGSYNPPNLGRFYYFNRKGLQIRNNRRHCPDDEEEPTCTKRYPVPSKRGSSFLFLWFCPAHGHCYGGHIVNGSEGRKDPMCSLYTHLAQPPEAIFYDFACGLEEYSLNRESGFFRWTRFYHDLFHRFNHKCSDVYHSKGVAGMDVLNSSICEQFNSYLQCIKSAGKHMTQEHFVFFCQFMIDIWNCKKEASFRKKLQVALSGAD